MKWNLLFAVLVLVLVGALLSTWGTWAAMGTDETSGIKSLALPKWETPTHIWDWPGAVFSYTGGTIQFIFTAFSFNVFGMNTSFWALIQWGLIALGAAIIGAAIWNWLFNRGS